MSDLSEVVAQGDRRRSLEVMRNRVAIELEDATGRDVAVLSKELRDVIRELDSLPVVGREHPLDQIAGAVQDDLAERRAARRTDAAGS